MEVIKMSDMIDSNQYEKYEKIALFIQPIIHKNLIATYEKYIKGKNEKILSKIKKRLSMPNALQSL